MKNLKKLFAVLAAIMMVLTLGTTAVKAHEVTIEKKGEEHEYEVYQIFTGDSAAGSKKLENIKYGANTTKGAAEAVAQADVDAIQNLKGNDDAETIAKVAPFVDLASTPFTTVKSGETVDLPTGYYLLKDKDDYSNANESQTKYVLFVVNEPTSVKVKVGTTTQEKKLKDTNDSTGTTSELQDTADYDIGDNVPYTLTAKLANNVTDYTKYHITFVDTLEAGTLKNNKDYVVKVNGVATTDYELTNESDNGFNLTLRWKGAEKADGKFAQITDEALNGATVTVEFTAELLEGANIGNLGNRNTSKLKFSNNPNSEDDGDEDEEETPEDTVIVFTYKLVVNKVDEGKKPLEGASFALYKKLANPATDDVACTEDNYKDYYLVSEINGAALSTFEWKGIDDGDYVLVETVTPAGYNAIDPIPFTVTADHKEGEVIDVNAVGSDSNGPAILTSLNGSPVDPEGEVSTGTLETNVENKFGAQLPETGGIGTTIFYTVGGLLVVGAIIMLIQKRRMAE